MWIERGVSGSQVDRGECEPPNEAERNDVVDAVDVGVREGETVACSWCGMLMRSWWSILSRCGREGRAEVEKWRPWKCGRARCNQLLLFAWTRRGQR
jgi:hypothetical protein